MRFAWEARLRAFVWCLAYYPRFLFPSCSCFVIYMLFEVDISLSLSGWAPYFIFTLCRNVVSMWDTSVLVNVSMTIGKI